MCPVEREPASPFSYETEELSKILKEKPLSSGTGRDVYEYRDIMVIKIPKNRKRKNIMERKLLEQQNRVELWVYRECPEEIKDIVCPVRFHSFHLGEPVLVTPKLSTLGVMASDRYRRLAEGNTCLSYIYNDEGFSGYGEMERKTKRLCELFELDYKDLVNNPLNWGILRDRVVYIDYGYRRKLL